MFREMGYEEKDTSTVALGETTTNLYRGTQESPAIERP